MSVLKKLNEARVKFHSADIKKSGHNKFAGYYYFELADFIVPALKIFNEVGLCSLVSFDAEKATMTITDLEDGSHVQITSPMSSAALKGCHEVQNLGAVQTYLRRYLWVAALDIVEHDAVDASEPVKGQPKANADGKGDVPQPRATPTGGVWDDLDKQDQSNLSTLADEVKEFLDAGDVPGAVGHLESLKLGADFKVAIWTRFDSKQRAAIKKFQQETK